MMTRELHLTQSSLGAYTLAEAMSRKGRANMIETNMSAQLMRNQLGQVNLYFNEPMVVTIHREDGTKIFVRVMDVQEGTRSPREINTARRAAEHAARRAAHKSGVDSMNEMDKGLRRHLADALCQQNKPEKVILIQADSDYGKIIFRALLASRVPVAVYDDRGRPDTTYSYGTLRPLGSDATLQEHQLLPEGMTSFQDMGLSSDIQVDDIPRCFSIPLTQDNYETVKGVLTNFNSYRLGYMLEANCMLLKLRGGK